MKITTLFFLVPIFNKLYTNATPLQTNLPFIEVVGNKFFNSETGEQFFLKGIAYQPSRSLDMLEEADATFETKYIDPLADPDICLRDLPYLKRLSINTVRVYSIDPTKSHDICMKAFADEGIYVLLDLAEPDISIDRNNPTWDITIWQRYMDVIDSMSQYSNLLGYFAGNEVTNDSTNTDASPFVKAAIRDIKKYINSMSYRSIPVGYSTNDDVDTRDNLANYFACNNNDDSETQDSSDATADFYGINMYEWCGYSSYGTSGYKDRTEEFKNYPVPVFFSEFGCNLVRPRPFTEVGALFGSKMTDVWSGGLVYMYFEEENQYGVVEISKTNQKVVKELDDFKYLEQQYKSVKPKGINKAEYIASNSYQKLKVDIPCPNNLYDADFNEDLDPRWEATKNALPPTPMIEECSCLSSYLPCQAIISEDTIKVENYFKYVCGQLDCQDIVADGKGGEYGIYSSCSVSQKLAFVLSKLYYNRLHEGTEDIRDKNCPIQDKGFYFNRKYLNFDEESSQCSSTALKNIERVLSSDYSSSKNNKVSSPRYGNNKNNKKNASRNIGTTHSVGIRLLSIFFVIATSLL